MELENFSFEHMRKGESQCRAQIVSDLIPWEFFSMLSDLQIGIYRSFTRDLF
jgi:hypothetical protein